MRLLGFLLLSFGIHAGLVGILPLTKFFSISPNKPVEVILVDPKPEQLAKTRHRPSKQKPVLTKKRKKNLRTKPVLAKKPEATQRQKLVTQKEESQKQNPAPELAKSKSGASSQDQQARGRVATLEEKYEIKIREFLQTNQRYPKIARRLRQQGRVVVRFVLDFNGKLIDQSIVKKAPFPILNSAAIKLVKNLDGQLPFYEGIDREKWAFVLPVEYKLQ